MVIVYLPNGIVRRCFFPGEEQAERQAERGAQARTASAQQFGVS